MDPEGGVDGAGHHERPDDEIALAQRFPSMVRRETEGFVTEHEAGSPETAQQSET